MSRRCLRVVASVAAAAAPFCASLAIEAQQSQWQARSPAQPPEAARSVDFFEANVRPVLAANCYDCHTDERMGGLRVDSRESLLKGGRSGPAIVPGDPEKSLLIQAVRQTSEKLKMPKGGHLRPDEIDTLVEWVKGGALWSSVATATAAGSKVPAV